MKRSPLCSILTVIFLLCVSAAAQYSPQYTKSDISSALPDDSTLSASLPRLVSYWNNRCSENPASVTFSLYAAESDETALWQETQILTADRNNEFVALVGVKSNGLPMELFSTSTNGARWLGMRCNGEAERPRILLNAVAYSVKSEDSANLGGKPASAYALVDDLNPTSGSAVVVGLNNEIARAQLIESNLALDLASTRNNIQSEVARALAAETAISTSLSNNVTALTALITDLQAQLAALRAGAPSSSATTVSPARVSQSVTGTVQLTRTQRTAR